MDCRPPGSFVLGVFQAYWSGLPFPSPGDLPNTGSPALQADSLPSEPPGKPRHINFADLFKKADFESIFSSINFLFSISLISFCLFVLFFLHKRRSQYQGIRKGRTKGIPLGVRTRGAEEGQASKGGVGGNVITVAKYSL